MSNTFCPRRVLARARSTVAIALAVVCIAPDPALADGNSVKGIVIGKNDHGAPLSGVSVQSETTVGGRPCLLQKVRTDKAGSFHVALDPACPFLTLRFLRAGYLDALVEVNNSAGENDVGAVELQRFSGRPIFSGGPPIKASKTVSRFKTIVIVAVIAITSAATVAALKR